MEPSAILRGLGFGPADLESFEFRVSYAQTSRMIRRLMQLLPLPHLGLTLGDAASLASWGLCLIGMMAARDSLEMLEFAIDYLPSTDRFLVLRRDGSDGEFAVVAEPRFAEPDVAAFLIENTFASLTRIGRFVVDPSFGPGAVSFSTPAPPDGAPHDGLFGCPVHFDQHVNRLSFARRARPIASADPLVARLCRQVLAIQSRSGREASELEAAIVRAIRSDLRKPPSVRAIAASINLSERTLRRRLLESDLSYATLLDNERMRRAVALLADPHRSLARVAEESGFTDTRSLRRAIKRWTGRSPTQIRHGDG